ncbi:hypothetical protein BaRGS_00029065 [Batillaria attramentaria]|uniref:Uncharacterized protein n=1 Tax=Batillaria attramentaria TaxID=370345 RepID=A0ABD0JX85_9CAEN
MEFVVSYQPAGAEKAVQPYNDLPHGKRAGQGMYFGHKVRQRAGKGHDNVEFTAECRLLVEIRVIFDILVQEAIMTQKREQRPRRRPAVTGQ